MVQYTYSSHRTRRVEKIRKQRVKYPQVAKNIVDTSDIILEVLDARFLEETRNRKLEAEIERQGKKIIYVLNKTDLLTLNKLQEIKEKVFPYAIVSCINRLGIKDLRNLIKRVAKTVEKREKREILKDKIVVNEKGGDKMKVGVIGYPNAGKSSLLNLLAGKSAAGVGADAGFTRNVQKIRLSEDIVLTDSPGVIPEDQYSLSDKEKIAEHSLAGGKSYTQIKEPDIVVMQLFKKYKDALNKFYKTEAEDSDDLIEEVGEQKRLLKKGGEINEDFAAREILKSWQLGKIKVGKNNQLRNMFDHEDVAREFAEKEQNETDYEIGEIIDNIVFEKLAHKELPIHIAELYAGAHPDRYDELFRILTTDKKNKFDWVDSSTAMLDLAKEYLKAGNLMKRFKSLDFIERDSIKYLKDLPNETLDLILLKESINSIENLDEFLKLTSEKLKEDSSLIATLPMTSSIIKSVSKDARFLHKRKDFPESETRELEEGEYFTMKYFKEKDNPQSGFIRHAELTQFYHSKEKIKELANKYNLKCFIGNWKIYTGEKDSDLLDYEILILEKN
ncbi:MAG: 50S ribosome-binding GTPase [Nanoarchaeota archaeon]|jgi:ribosome biogenesis GTPase A/predicted TPR repeat methyltransferase|nr:50S ribosome-binding GTPase [Nanoarchaeota archaeon]